MNYIFFVKGERFESPNDFFLTYTPTSAPVVQNSDIDGDGCITSDEVGDLDTYLSLANREDVRLSYPLPRLGQIFWRNGEIFMAAGAIVGIGGALIGAPAVAGFGVVLLGGGLGQGATGIFLGIVDNILDL